MLGEVGSWSGLAVTYSPASWDAVPLAVRRLTAEFGMGSGVSAGLWPPDRIRAPASIPGRGRVAAWEGRGSIRRRIRVQGVLTFGDGFRLVTGRGCPCLSLDRIKPIGRLVPVR